MNVNTILLILLLMVIIIALVFLYLKLNAMSTDEVEPEPVVEEPVEETTVVEEPTEEVPLIDPDVISNLTMPTTLEPVLTQTSNIPDLDVPPEVILENQTVQTTDPVPASVDGVTMTNASVSTENNTIVPTVESFSQPRPYSGRSFKFMK